MKLIATIFLFLISIPLFANENITGVVVDDNNQPIAFAQITVLDGDSIAIANTQSGLNGSFKLNDLRANILNISAFGFSSQSIPIATKYSKIDTIKLSPSPLELNEVIVSASIPTMKLSNGELIVNVAGSYLSQMGTANNVLSNLPLVTGSDGDFTVFGKGKPLIFINGKKLMNTSELDQLSSTDIKDVKIITNPGAKYDATFKSVIQIRTKKAKGEGIGLNVRMKGNMASYLSVLGQINLSYRTRNLDLGVISYVTSDKKIYDSNLYQRTSLKSLVEETLEQTAIDKPKEYIEKFTINYEFCPNHSIGGYYRLSMIEGKNKTVGNGNFIKDGILNDEIGVNGLSFRKLSYSHSSNIYYSGRIGAWELDFNMDYLYTNPSIKSVKEEQSSYSGDRIVTSESETHTRFIAHKATASYSFGLSHITLGEEFTKSNMLMVYLNTEGIVPSHNNEIQELNQAVFAEYSQKIGQYLQFDAGVRFEHIRHHYRSNEGAPTRKIYNNLFPSVGISSQIGNLSMSLSYTNKTERPTYPQLNGNIQYDNRYQFQKGNPELRSVSKGVFELMAQYQPLFMQVSYQNQRHPIIYNAIPYDSESNINVVSYINGPTIRELDAIVGVNFDKKLWNLQISGGLAKQWFKTTFNSELIYLNNPIGLVKIEGFLKLPFDVRFMCDYTFQTKGNMQNTYIGSHSILNVGLYKTFCGGKFDIRISGKDLLNGICDRATMYSGNVFINTIERYDSRSCEITLRYNINVPKNKYRGKGAGLTEKERL